MEYAGYKPVKGIDISGLTGKIADKVFTIGEEREAKRQELDDLAQEAKKGMFIPMTDNNALNKKIEGLTGTSTDLLYGLNKDLRSGKKTPSEYKRAVNSLLANVDNMKKMADQYDKRIESAADRIDKGEAGALQAEQIRFMDETLNLNNDWGIDEDTFDMYMLTKDGRKVYADWINKDGNLTSRKIDLSKKAKDNMIGWSAESIREAYGIGGSITYESLRANKAFAAEVEAFAYAMTQGDNLQSILLDNGGLKGSPLFIYSKDQAQSVIQEEVDKFSQINGRNPNEEELESIENRVVFMDQNGEAQFTEKQIEMGKERARDEIYIRAAEIDNLSVQRPFDPRDKSTSTSRKAEIEQQSYNEGTKLAIQVMNAAPYETEVFEKLENYAKKNGQNIKIRKEKQADGTFKVLVDRVEYSKRFPRLEEWVKTEEGKKAVADSKKESDPELELESLYKEKILDDDSRKTISQTIVQSTKEIPTTKDLSEFIFPGLPGATRNLFELGVEGLASEGYTEDTHKRYKAYIYSLDRANKKHVTEEEWINLGMPSAYGETPTTTEEIPTYSKADLLSNGWTQENINEAVKQGKIKVN